MNLIWFLGTLLLLVIVAVLAENLSATLRSRQKPRATKQVPVRKHPPVMF